MIKSYDHLTIAVTNLESAKEFFQILGFETTHDLVIEGEPFSTFMDIKNLKAQHVTLKHQAANVEIQLLYFYSPEPQTDPHIGRLDKLGYNHLCFGVKDIEAVVETLKTKKIKILSHIMTFNSRKLVYIRGPEGVVIELAEWLN
ncbi:VOC family protein [Piscirickettsia litoralis]|uniref:Glyoxalase n=1 Tax=Piscirickettsia litoralis TaxID=1891921 RepID=A0ABX3A512_9GAMM|nr:VOC family protein [Piscirickettsia litoralis]ODN43518.1 glyoxalase [Piscirickettsia litoralis]